MDFMPQSNWQWVFDKQRSVLTLQMDELVIDLIYKSNMLVLPDENKPIPFTVEDVARYIELFENSALEDYQAEFACKIILHILAIDLFHKPIMPKSWLFVDPEVDCSSRIDLMSHVTMTAKGDLESAHYLVLEDEEDFVLCMLLDKIHQLTPRKALSQFQIIKVTADKLSLIKGPGNYWHSFQIA